MGAWGAGNFENDTALDWIWDLKKSRKLRLIESTISAVISALKNTWIRTCAVSVLLPQRL